MASQAPSTFNFPTLKRSACDRCRKQKLRCPRRASDTQPCARCVRAGVECITGYTRPLGRSNRIPYASAHSQNLSQSHAFPVVSQQQFNSSAALQDLPNSPSITKHVNTRPRQTTLSDTGALVASSPTFFTEFGEESNSFAYPEMLDSLSGMQVLADNSHADYDTNIDNDSGFLLLSPQFLETGEATCSSGSTPGDSTPSTISTENAFSRTLSSVDSDLRLSHLSMTLCRQAQRNMVPEQQDGRAQTVANTASIELETEPKPLSGFLDTSGQSKEFGDALCSTSEFMAIIQSKLDDMALNDPTTRRETHQDLMNLSCVLNLISCYLLIVGVFEKLVLRLYEQTIRNGSETSSFNSSKTSQSAVPQAFLGLHLGSFHIHQSNLQTKLLVQIIEHQFEMIEKSLGLPVELRVSSGRWESCKGGLLQSALDESLLQAVITRLCPIPGSLASLRENMMRVRRVLAT